jgi:hypothetical protein
MAATEHWVFRVFSLRCYLNENELIQDTTGWLFYLGPFTFKTRQMNKNKPDYVLLFRSLMSCLLLKT